MIINSAVQVMEGKTSTIRLVAICGILVFIYQSYKSFEKLLNPPRGTSTYYGVEKELTHPTIEIYPTLASFSNFTVQDLLNLSKEDYVKVNRILNCNN